MLEQKPLKWVSDRYHFFYFSVSNSSKVEKHTALLPRFIEKKYFLFAEIALIDFFNLIYQSNTQIMFINFGFIQKH